MATLFDVLTVSCFVGLAVAFFFWTDRENRTLLHFVISGTVLAVANQIGNAGQTLFALLLIVAGILYAIIVAWRPAS